MGTFQKCILIPMLVLVGIYTPVARAGPPFITDDPDPTDYKHWEVYLFADYYRIDGADQGQFPAMEINYGLLPNMQLHVIPAVAYDHQPGEVSHYGIGDTEFGVKYRFVQETDTIPEIGVFPLLEFPSGNADHGLGNGKLQVFAPVWLQKTFGKDKEWTTFGGGGFWYNPGPDHRNFFRLGWALQRDFSEHITLGAEIYHESAASRDVGGHTAFNIGGYYNFDDHNHLLMSAGRDIDGPDRFACYAAYQITF